MWCDYLQYTVTILQFTYPFEGIYTHMHPVPPLIKTHYKYNIHACTWSHVYNIIHVLPYEILRH